jgi:O-antigen ligase
MPPHSAAIEAAIRVRRATLIVFLAIVLLFESPVPLPVLTPIAALVAGACTTALVAARGHGWVWPVYWLYLAGVAVSATASAAPGVWPAFFQQLAFVMLLWSVADDVRSWADGPEHVGGLGAWLTLLLVGLALILPQLAGPRSVFDFGRPYHYRAVQQWSGYPEIGILCAMAAVATWAIAQTTRDRVLRLAALTLCMAFSAATAFVQSRAALLALGVVAAWMAALAAWRWRSWISLAALVAGLVVGGGLLWGSPHLADRLTSASAVNAAQDRPLSMRQDIWGVAWTLVRAHPWTGVGPGQFQREYTRAGAPGTPGHAHNMMLHVAAEYGLPTLLCYLVLWGRLLWRTGVAASRTALGQASWAVHAMLLVFFVRSLGEHFLGGLDTSLRMLALVAFIFGLAEFVAARRAPGQRTAV